MTRDTGMLPHVRRTIGVFLLGVAMSACGGTEGRQCASTLRVPDGFCATVFAEGLGAARHVVVRDDGTVYVAVWHSGARNGVVALRDTNGDGRADVRVRFGPDGGAGLAIDDSLLYFATRTTVYRYRLVPGAIAPPGDGEIVVLGLSTTEHEARSIALGDSGRLFVNIGAESNACERDYSGRDYRGDDPCRALETTGGIWAFSANGKNQRQRDGSRYATGLRHTIALAWNPRSRSLFGAPHNIDHFHSWWPNAGFTERDAATRPAEEFVEIREGRDYGFPYCYFDPDSSRMLLSPAYGGNGTNVGRCKDATGPALSFPAHSAPMAIAFHPGNGYPSRYAAGAFVAFHGSSWHEPLSLQGDYIAFVPFSSGQASGTYEIFADPLSAMARRIGMLGARLSGVAVGPDGSLYVTDDQKGTVWRVTYRAQLTTP